MLKRISNYFALFFTVIIVFQNPVLIFSNNQEFIKYDYLYQKFVEGRSYENAQELLEVVKLIEDNIENIKTPLLYEYKLLLAESYLQLGMLTNSKKKQIYLENALKISEELIKVQQDNGKVYYVLALACSQLIEFVNVFQKLSLLSKFDDYMMKALKYLQDDTYKGLAYMSLGIRYMTPPWPLYDLSKSNFYFKEAKNYISDYSGLYLNWGYLFLKMNDKERAVEMFEKVLSTPINKMFRKAHERNVEIARKELEKLKK